MHVHTPFDELNDIISPHGVWCSSAAHLLSSLLPVFVLFLPFYRDHPPPPTADYH